MDFPRPFSVVEAEEQTVSAQSELFRQFIKAREGDPELYETAQELLTALDLALFALESSTKERQHTLDVIRAAISKAGR